MRDRLDKLWYPPLGQPENPLLGATLAPLSWIYRAGLRIRARSIRSIRLEKPVVSVGNLSLGGAGKTPLVIEIAGRIQDMGKRVAVVSRGYGRKTRGVVVVQRDHKLVASVTDSGDEPFFIAACNPAITVVVGEDRVKAAQKAIQLADPDVIVCDDGFQHRRLHRDLDIVAVHSRRGFGNRKLFPRGPLREPVQSLERADLVIFTYAGNESEQDLRSRYGLADTIPVLVCGMDVRGLVKDAEIVPIESLYGLPVLAVCGIADPIGFFTGCESAGLRLVGRMQFPDHHFFLPRDLHRIRSQIERCRARAIVVTDKDLVRIAKHPWEVPVFGLRIGVRWNAPVSKMCLDAMLTGILYGADAAVQAARQ